MKNLKAEMVRFGISNSDIQSLLKCSAKTATNKLNGKTDFTVPEAFKIRKKFFPSLTLEYLFEKTG